MSPTAGLRHHRLIADDGEPLAVVEAGDPNGRPVLLIHGWSLCSVAWTRQLASPLLAGLRLIAVDLRGHGGSGGIGVAGLSSAAWAADLALVCEELRLSDVVAVGWSYGAIPLGCFLQERGTGPVSAVCLVAPGTHNGAAALSQQELSAAGQDAGLCSDEAAMAVPALTDFVRACAAPAPLAAADEALLLGATLLAAPATRRCMLAVDVDHRRFWASLPLPLDIVWGTADSITAPASSARTAASNRHAVEHRFEGSGHMPFWDAPGRFANCLLAIDARNR